MVALRLDPGPANEEGALPRNDTKWADAITKSGNVVMAMVSAPYEPGKKPQWVRPAAESRVRPTNFDADLGYAG